nr:MAG TPA: hypothetical protein [Caudoviricetes sp.]
MHVYSELHFVSPLVWYGLTIIANYSHVNGLF